MGCLKSGKLRRRVEELSPFFLIFQQFRYYIFVLIIILTFFLCVFTDDIDLTDYITNVLFSS